MKGGTERSRSYIEDTELAYLYIHMGRVYGGLWAEVRVRQTQVRSQIGED